MASFGTLALEEVRDSHCLTSSMARWNTGKTGVGKAYVSLFKVEALRVLENAEVATIPSTDDALEQTELVDTEVMKFSRQWHYLLTPITSESARLVVRGNTELNGFESWRLLAKRF